MECTRWHKNQQAYLEVIWKENKTDDVICLHFGVYGNICGHMIPSSVNRNTRFLCYKVRLFRLKNAVLSVLYYLFTTLFKCNRAEL